jgi:type I restriction enzyme S subunit
MYGEGKTRGNVSIIKSEMATNQACCNIELDPELADFEYVYYFLKTQYNELRSLSSGVRKNLNSEDIKNFVIRLPQELKDQRKVAAVLSALDAKIDCNNRINAELEAMAKALYDYWFVQFEFPDANGKPYKSSGGKMVYNATLGREIPLGWRGGIASDLFDFNPTLSLAINTMASYVDMASLPVTGFMTDEPERKPFAGGMKFQNGDVVVARITPCLENGKTALITLLKNGDIGFGSTEFIVIRGKTAVLSAYAAQMSRSAPFRHFAITNMTGTSGRKRIDANTLKTFPVPLPPEDILLIFEQVTGFFLSE